MSAVAWRFTLGELPPLSPYFRVTQVTYDSGLTFQPAISPDGTLIAFASDRSGDGNLDIWVKHMGGGEPIRLTRNAADDSQPSFSPDGSRLVFRSERDGGGIFSGSGAVTVADSNISYNSADGGEGGGIDAFEGIAITSSAINYNSAGFGGGGGLRLNGGNSTITDSTMPRLSRTATNHSTEPASHSASGATTRSSGVKTYIASR